MKGVHFKMSKLTREQKIEMYHKRESGVTVRELAKEYKIRKDNIHYLIRLIEKHGEGILRNDKNRYYSSSLKEEIINKVLLDNHSVSSIAIEYGLSSDGMLFHWIKSYKENGYVIVEKTKGRRSTMKPNLNKEYTDMTPEEKARQKIDRWFADAGWKVVNRDEYEPTCTAVAIREGLLKGNLEADYFLFINVPLPKFYTFKSREERERILYRNFVNVGMEVKEMIKDVLNKRKAK